MCFSSIQMQQTAAKQVWVVFQARVEAAVLQYQVMLDAAVAVVVPVAKVDVNRRIQVVLIIIHQEKVTLNSVMAYYN